MTLAGAAQITNVLFTPTSLRSGALLNVSITVRNDSAETLETQGPDPGFAYDEGDTFATRGFPDTTDKFRVGIDFDGRTGIDHPYRWGLGAPLAPGQSVTVTGAIRLETARAIKYWAGLVREHIAWLQDRQGTQTITVTPAGSPQITGVTFSPTTLRSGALLNISITVRNDSDNTLETQGPDPGFAYDEGDTFATRGFPDIAKSFRVGIDFDGRTGIDHPYRWGLGAPLAPGQSATTTGTIRLKTPRAIKYWAGLVREHIAWLQDRQGAQTITVAPPGAPQIINVTFNPTSLHTGALLNVSVTVRNDSDDMLETQGPDPGFVYDEGDTFATRGFPDTTDKFRVGIDFDGRTGIDHPYRWGLGAPLAPGESVTVTGAIRLQTARAIKYWAGLVREHIAWLQDRQGTQTITVTPPPPVEITNVTFSPTTLSADELLNLSITIVNNSTETIGTQGPDPGFIYQEGDTFHSLGFDEVRGAYRVAIDSDAPTDVDYPYRWGLGAPLAPGETRTITGALRVQSVRAINYWAGLVQEKIAWLEKHRGTQQITVVPAPTLAFTATPSAITVGEVATLEWYAPDAREVTLDGEPVAFQGSRLVAPTETTTYTLHIVFLSGITRDLSATVRVSPIPQPTRPPTVTITPENVALLQTFPRPANDNGRGLHFTMDLRYSSVFSCVEHLLSIGCKWTRIYAPDELQAKQAAQACWQAGIMPVVRIGKKVDEAFDPVQYVDALKSIGAPPYVQIYNEPGDIREWKTWPGDDNWIGIFANRWARHAATVFDEGGYPGLQILAREEFDAVVDAVASIGRMDIWQRAFFALHNYGANHPPNYPYDPLNPGQTIFGDDVAVLVFLEYAAWMQERIGFVLPCIGGEGGWQFGAEEDNRYPKVEAPLHAQYHAEMFDWFRTNILSNGEPLPDYLFSVTPWIAGGWGADDWWGGILGDKTQTIAAVQALPPFVRRFSWDPPKQPYSFTVKPDTIFSGETATLLWNIPGATQVTLDGAPVDPLGARNVTPLQTTTYVLRVAFADATAEDLTVTLQVVAFPPLEWDARLDELGVQLTRSSALHAWRLVSAIFQDTSQSGGNHHIFYTALNTDGSPAAGLRFVMDWHGRDPADQPGIATTDANGAANIPMWASMNPDLKNGPYFATTMDQPGDKVSGMGLPLNHHVNFVLTFKCV